MLKPFEAIINEINDRNIIKYLDSCKKLFFEFNFKAFFPSTITKLDIALIRVSTVLIVKDIARTITTNDRISEWFLSKIEKKARSGFTFKSWDTAIKPLNPIKKTIGIIIIKEIDKLFFNTSLFFAAKILCQFPWWNKLVAATAIKKVIPAVKLGT